MKWNEFLEKLAQARELKKDKKISVSAIANLIFSGAFDSMLEADKTPSLATYRQMFDEVKAIKKSKAKLPSKKKDEFIGLDEVNSEIKLGFWRCQRCPIVKKVAIEKEFASVLATFGFEQVTKAGSIFTFVRGTSKEHSRPPCYATPKWSALFANPQILEIFKKCDLLIYGMVHSVNIRSYGGGKEMMVIKMFTGQEITDDLVLWPKRDTGKISEVYKAEIKSGELCGLIVKPGKYKGKPNGTVLANIRFSQVD